MNWNSKTYPSNNIKVQLTEQTEVKLAAQSLRKYVIRPNPTSLNQACHFDHTTRFKELDREMAHGLYFRFHHPLMEDLAKSPSYQSSCSSPHSHRHSIVPSAFHHFSSVKLKELTKMYNHSEKEKKNTVWSPCIRGDCSSLADPWRWSTERDGAQSSMALSPASVQYSILLLFHEQISWEYFISRGLNSRLMSVREMSCEFLCFSIRKTMSLYRHFRAYTYNTYRQTDRSLHAAFHAEAYDKTYLC